MKVSCIMPTADRRSFIPAAIGYFLAQDYPDKELIVLDDGRDNVSDLIPAHPQIRYLRHDRRQSLGRKRNICCAQAQGELIAHWDDDDWYAPFRLRRQVAALLTAGADICGIDRVLFLDTAARRAWEYVYPSGQAPWVCGATLCYTKSFWRENPFREIDIGEDSRFVSAARGARIEVMPDNDIFVGMIHRANTSPKRMRDPRWQKRTFEAVEAVMRQPSHISSEADAHGPAPSLKKPAALVTAAAGIGDIIRVTPLVRVLHGLGYEVDLMLSPDDPACLELFRGAPELRRVIHVPGGARKGPIPELARQRYALATFTALSAPLAGSVDAKDRHIVGRAEWLTHGDIRSVEKIARTLGWQGPLPAPFVCPSERRFDLPAGTVALHPGCKATWPWKKWHGFEALAHRLPHVVIVGSDADRDNSATYFKRAFAWPGHARDFTGQLGLSDTAALIGQCAALIANDSGLMHVGVAIGVPTFGIFGITSPQREAIPSPSMIPVTKQLRCEAGCRREPWGRRDCHHHLECLKMLTADEVLARVHERLPELRPPPPAAHPVIRTGTIRLNYYGFVFDASGYGQAARAYVHALHAAGVKLSVIDLAGHPPQTEDALVTSLLGNDGDADFNLLHAIPSYWPGAVHKLRNVIAMTVWETDTMPSQWHVPLARAIDVWLPCQFNAAAFSRGLQRTTFVLPHAVPPAVSDVAVPCPVGAPLVADSDFVFYSIFEWQERKNPGGMIKAFLRAFPEANDAVLVLKTNPGAAAEANAMLRKIRTGTRGRVVLCCEAWSEAQLRAFHARGDCYVSLHKGEGWGYPLFDAAARGKPVIASDYSAPQDYLDRRHHWLVRCSTAPVRQNYQFYRMNMKWAEPDVAHAAEGMRWVHGHRDEARNGAAQVVGRLLSDFSIESVGASAKARLLALREQIASRQTAPMTPKPAAGAPIPGKWYDADYFELGRKSNWRHGYSWPLFKNVFEGAADYLTEIFPAARSVLDIGCAKGFLVRALRARQLDAWGFDHSPFAIRNADPAAKRFVSRADAATATCGRQFDVLVAMSIFESLTEAQLAVVLPRIRPWAGQALFAVIPTLESGAECLPGVDRDLSHITLRDRVWWEQRFIAAGWRQFGDGFEQRCRAHPFAVQMEWSVYVLSPDR
ncbi:MAG: methyltransferase protein [Xanthobacteraceae bacterium]|nr:methyltransferase protein [Xanthobacteraceae bacterium]